MPDKIGILYLFAQRGFGADAAVQADILRHLDRDEFRVHVACNAADDAGEPESLTVLRGVADISLRPTRFAPSLGARDLPALRKAARFIRVTSAGQRESAPHDIIEVKATK